MASSTQTCAASCFSKPVTLKQPTQNSRLRCSVVCRLNHVAVMQYAWYTDANNNAKLCIKTPRQARPSIAANTDVYSQMQRGWSLAAITRHYNSRDKPVPAKTKALAVRMLISKTNSCIKFRKTHSDAGGLSGESFEAAFQYASHAGGYIVSGLWSKNIPQARQKNN